MKTSRASQGSESKKAETVTEITHANIDSLVREEEKATPPRTWSESIARWVTWACGSAWFLWAHVILFVTWIAINAAFPSSYRWDPFPFHILAITVPLEALFLSMFILITQRREMLLSERRTQLGLQITLLAEQENTETLKLLTEIAMKLGIPSAHKTELKALQEKTEPQAVLEQIDNSVNGARNR